MIKNSIIMFLQLKIKNNEILDNILCVSIDYYKVVHRDVRKCLLNRKSNFYC